MQASAIPASVRYMSDGANCAWPIPFPFASPAQVAASLMAPDGSERRLEMGKTCLVSSNFLMAVVPAGHIIEIWLEAPLETALAQSAARAMEAQANSPWPAGAAPAAMPLAVQAEDVQSQPAPDPALADMERRIAAIEADKEAALAAARQAEEDRQIKRIAESADSGAAKIAQAADEAADNAAKSISAQAEDAAKSLDQTAGNAQSLAEEALHKAEAAEAAAQAALAEVQSALAELRQTAQNSARDVEQAASAAASGFESQKEKSIREVREAGHCAMEQARRNCELPGHAWPRGAVITQPFDLAAGAIMDLPLLYYPGRDSLLITRNGDSLAPGIDYEETRPHHGHESHSIRLLKPSPACAVWTFWVPPTNSSQAADISAKEAGSSAKIAAESRRIAVKAADCARKHDESAARHAAHTDTACRLNLAQMRQTADKNIKDIRKTARESESAINHAAHNSITTSRRHAQCAAQSRAQSHEQALLANRNAIAAWEAAWQASIAAARPGIAAIRDLSEISKCVSGIYIINPNLVRSPTIFMGIWPVASKADIAWDGLFFIGIPYSDDPLLPPRPPKPEEPKPCPPPPNPEADDWLPCHHKHGEDNAEEELEGEG